MPAAASRMRHWARLASSPLRMLPAFVVIGEAKCGTTSLYRYLEQHPDVVTARRKEPANFLRYPASGIMCRYEYPLALRAWGRRLVRLRPLVAGEATAEYLWRLPPRDMLAVVPQVRIIALLRNPVARALSEYTMMSRHGLVDGGFGDIARDTMRWLSDERLATVVHEASMQEHSRTRFVTRGIYAWSLTAWWRQVAPERRLVLRAEDLFAEPAAVTARVHQFLGLDVQPPADVAPRRASDGHAVVEPALLEELTAFYEPFNRELYALIGRDLQWESGVGAPGVSRAA